MRSELLARAEACLESWARARGQIPTQEAVEGFRLLALHRQGARGVPSFNACRETCREIAYHYNLLCDSEDRVRNDCLVSHVNSPIGKLKP